MNKQEGIDLLKERIKELSCLYDVASISNSNELEFEEILQKIVQRIPEAWQFSDLATCELRLEEIHLFSASLPSDFISQKQAIFIHGKYMGELSVHYANQTDKIIYFLEEEEALLKQLCLEISYVLERKINKDKEAHFIQSHQRKDRLSILGEITAGIAHELNTPLGNILGFAQLIMDDSRNEQTLSDAEKIMNSAIHAREVVKKLMFFSCELPQRFEFIPINKILDEAIRLLIPSSQKKNLKMVFERDENEPLVQLDSIQITQVVFNLIINAIHISEENKSIFVRIHSDEKYVYLAIEDQGKGIPLEIRDKIFEPFFTTKDVGEGSGLGLSVVHGIIRAHQGEINVQSEVGEGTIFLVKLPKKQST